MNLNELTIHEGADLLARREVTSAEITSAVLERIAEVDEDLDAFVTVSHEVAMVRAQKADELIRVGENSRFTGIPAVIKDNICTRAIRTTCASKILKSFIPPYDATVMEKLNGQGIVIVGKSNMDEFAMGSSNENSGFYLARNPWDAARVPGGSSGGSAVAVAADETVFALGSDTGGSIRQPAGFCSVVGLKPTYGRVSRYGLVAFGSSLDQIGPITKDVTDAALVMNVIAGHDPRDSTTVPHPVPDYTRSLVPDIEGLRLGVPKEYFVEGMEDGVKRVIEAAIAKLEELGANVEEMSLPSTGFALSVYYIIAPSEASANLARYNGVKYGYAFQDTDSMWEAMEKTREYGFGPEVKRRIMLGTYALSAGYYDAYYLKAQKVRTLIRREFSEAFERYDALITPTSPTVPFSIGERVDDPLAMYLADVCTLPISIAGIPGISIPAGFAEGLPVGMQILARPFDEEMLFRIAYAFEQATDWHRRKPLI